MNPGGKVTSSNKKGWKKGKIKNKMLWRYSIRKKPDFIGTRKVSRFQVLKVELVAIKSSLKGLTWEVG